ncbi:MAG: decaprenyl-phosphate phosphoribosyltransferase, partial [Candidatus Omnitrophica bacterium]|nr:decaprenyl-phosphate phosphoribosyltransferase [Candidatus Omnitrophota bacterium]
LIRTARPRQWLKNLSLFAAPVFAAKIFETTTFNLTFYAFIAFCLLSSGSYFLNDIIDAPKDRLHPIKKNRPIASGRLSPKLAAIVAFAMIIASVLIGFNMVGTYFGLSLFLYVVLQASYSLYFRNVIILDSLVVATGFVLRVFAGGLASNTSISSWLALTTIGISLLLAFGKRRSEKTILAKYPPSQDGVETRKTLRHYPDNLLDGMISMSATYAIITYSLFVFQISPSGANDTLFKILPSILKTPKWMMLTIPLVIYGVARYLYVIYEKGEAESPERVLLSDKPLLFTVTFWGLLTMLIIFLIPDL